jgi:uncharacterized protein
MDRDPVVDGPLIRGFVGNGFRIQDSRVDAVLMTASDAREWTPPAIDALTVDAFEWLIEARPEFILIGTGKALVRPPLPLIKALEDRGIGIEPMDSRAAARAWGVLRADGRHIAAALYPLDR